MPLAVNLPLSHHEGQVRRWSFEPTLMEGCRVEADANVDRLSEGEF
jgi:hypothetical protein